MRIIVSSAWSPGTRPEKSDFDLPLLDLLPQGFAPRLISLALTFLAWMGFLRRTSRRSPWAAANLHALLYH
jgi:hypothetical protein